MFISHSSQVERAHHTTLGHMKKYQGWSGGRKSEGKIHAQAFIVVFMGKNGQDNLSISKLAHLNNFRRLCDTGMGPSYPVHSPGMI